MDEQKKDKGGRRRGIAKKTIGFKVPVVVAEEVKEEARPIIDNIVKKKMKKLLPILLILFASCSKGDRIDAFVKVTVSQGGESVLVTGYLQAPAKDTHVYLIEADECGVKMIREVRVAPGQTVGTFHYQTNCKVGQWKIVYDDILRQ